MYTLRGAASGATFVVPIILKKKEKRVRERERERDVMAICNLR